MYNNIQSFWRLLMTSVEGDNNVNDHGHIREIYPITHNNYNVNDDCGDDDVNLRMPLHDSEPEATLPSPSPSPPSPLLYWVKLGVSIICLSILGFVVINWVGPFFIQKVFIPVIIWQRDTFTTSELAIYVFASIALFPTIFLPSSPSMWVAGMTFGYFFGFFLVMSAAAVGVSLPFFTSKMFHHKIEEWLDQYPKEASVLRSAGGGNWFHQFRAVALIRVSPFPYMIYNYCATATNVQYGPYLCGSLAGMLPEVIASIYTGILIRALANVSHKTHGLSAPQIAFNVVGFCIAVATTIFFTIYAKRRLNELRQEEELQSLI